MLGHANLPVYGAFAPWHSALAMPFACRRLLFASVAWERDPLVSLAVPQLSVGVIVASAAPRTSEVEFCVLLGVVRASPFYFAHAKVPRGCVRLW